MMKSIYEEKLILISRVDTPNMRNTKDTVYTRDWTEMTERRNK